MAFTSSEKTKIRHYLGYPQVYRFEDPRLEGAIDTVGNDADAVSLVQDLLAKIDNVRAQLGSVALPSAGLKSLDKGDVELYDHNAQTEGMRGIGRGYCAELSGLFGIPLHTDIFGEVGYAGDKWVKQNGRSRVSGICGLG